MSFDAEALRAWSRGAARLASETRDEHLAEAFSQIAVNYRRLAGECEQEPRSAQDGVICSYG